MIESHRLKYLCEAATLGSMTAASEKLGLATSSISRQIAQIEQELGIDLIERHRRSIKLTEAGEIAVRYYRESVASNEALASELESLKGAKTGSVVIAAGEGFAGDSLISIIDDFSMQHPDVKVSVELGATTNDVIAMVKQDDAHIGLAFHIAPDPAISIHASIEQPIVALFAPTHPFARKKKIKLAELERTKLALPSHRLRIREMFDSAASDEGVLLSPSLTTDSLLLMKSFAQTAGGATLLPLIAASREIERDELKAVNIASRPLNGTAANVIIRNGRRLPVGAQILLGKLKNLR